MAMINIVCSIISPEFYPDLLPALKKRGLRTYHMVILGARINYRNCYVGCDVYPVTLFYAVGAHWVVSYSGHI